MNNININVSEDITLAFIVAILGIAFPIIIQTISGIDTKYSSTRLVHKIDRSWQFKFMNIMLIIAVVTRFYYCFAPSRTVDWGRWNPILEKSAILMCIITTLFLIISLALFTYKLLIFYKPDCLLRSIHKDITKYYRNYGFNIENKKSTSSYQRQKELKETTLFQDLNDLAIYIVNSKNENTIQQLFQSLHDISYEFMEGGENNEVNFPPAFYELIISINQMVCQQSRQLRSISNTNITTFIFFNTVMRPCISMATYSCMWQCIRGQLYNKRQDLVFKYWEYAYEHYSHFLKNNKENEKFEFKLFTTVLASFLLYKKEYDLLSDIIQYTNSSMIIYDSLILDNYPEIIKMYIEILRRKRRMLFWFEQQYPFDDMRRGVYNNSLIKSWIDKFLVILMMRIELVYKDSDKARMPDIPNTIKDKYDYLRNITNILKIAEKGIDEIDVNLIFKGLSEKLKDVISKLKKYINELTYSIDKQEIKQSINSNFSRNFCNSVIESVSNFKSILDAIFKKKEGDEHNVFIGFSDKNIQEKKLYYINNDLFSGYLIDNKSYVLNKLYYNFCMALSRNSNIVETCSRIDLLKILDRLQLDKNHIIIASSPDYNKWFAKMENNMVKESDIKYIYRETPFFKLNLGFSETCIWVLQSNDLYGYMLGDHVPNKGLSPEIEDSVEGVYVAVIDLNKNKSIIEKLKKEYGDKYNYDKSVLELIDVNIKLCFVEHPKILQIMLLDQWSRIPYTIWQEVKKYDEYFINN